MQYFLDPVLRGPTIGSMLMCLGAAIIGVIVFLRKESLLGESLSHASYPGVAAGAVIASLITGDLSGEGTVSILLGAFLSAMFGFVAIVFLEKRFHIHSDAALCFILASFFGVGIVMASRLQFSHSAIYRQIQLYLYGQAATMDDRHILWYGSLALLVIILASIFYKEIKTITFDPDYAYSLGIPIGWINSLFFSLVAFSIVIGIRSVGVVLMSAMLIAPATAARQFTNHLGRMFLYAALFGLAAGFLGNYFSNELTILLESHYPGERLSLPTGPMIVLIAISMSLLSLLFAPEKGWIVKLFRQNRFQKECLRENLLKEVWRNGGTATVPQIAEKHSNPLRAIQSSIRTLVHQGFMTKAPSGEVSLPKAGSLRAAHIVRLHRLWELYLVDELGIGAEKVHRSAEEMEHILTPELEKRLEATLGHPTHDPHHKPIPPEPSL